jgi:hypothetical protein
MIVYDNRKIIKEGFSAQAQKLIKTETVSYW